jgi:hypothetical protein
MQHVLSVGYMTDFFQKQLNLSKFLKLMIWRCSHTGCMHGKTQKSHFYYSKEVIYKNNAIWFHPILHIHAEIGPLERSVDQSSKEGSDISLVPTPRPTHFKQLFKSKPKSTQFPKLGFNSSHLQIPQHPKDSKQCIHISPRNKYSQIHSSPLKTRNRTNAPKFIHPNSKPKTTKCFWIHSSWLKTRTN